MVMFAWGAKVFFDLYRPPAGAMEIFVVGKQWMWKVQHADGQREINELHVPIGRPVKLIMGSEDVIHSYYIPAFRVKADVIPGRYNTMWFTATKPGTLSPVLRRVLRHQALGDDRLRSSRWSRPSIQAWLDGGTADGLAGRRRREAVPGSQRCITCHTAGPQARGPSARRPLRHEVEAAGRRHGRSPTRPTSASRSCNPQAKIVDGFQPIMPTFQGLVTEEQLLQLIAYVQSLNGRPRRQPPRRDRARRRRRQK